MKDHRRFWVRLVRLRASSELGNTTTYLIGKGAGTEITKRKLESAVGTVDVDLEGDKSVGVGC
jgi:membrane protein YqaA with SNARE-associated domain